jgi:peptidoglycan hydrolase CwlO-like protein
MVKQDIAEIAELLVKAYEKNLYGERKDSFIAMAESVVEKIESLEKENAELKAEIKELRRKIHE